MSRRAGAVDLRHGASGPRPREGGRRGAPRRCRATWSIAWFSGSPPRRDGGAPGQRPRSRPRGDHRRPWWLGTAHARVRGPPPRGPTSHGPHLGAPGRTPAAGSGTATRTRAPGRPRCGGQQRRRPPRLGGERTSRVLGEARRPAQRRTRTFGSVDPTSTGPSTAAHLPAMAAWQWQRSTAVGIGPATERSCGGRVPWEPGPPAGRWNDPSWKMDVRPMERDGR
jgi:hypothetical protein